MARSNLFVLFFCQLISATGSIVLVTLGGIIGATLSVNPALSTLPVSMMVVSVAVTTVPATMLMRRIGRKKAFMLASLSAAASVLLAAYALQHESFVHFTIAAAVFGINMAFTQQYRYAATESVPPQRAGRAVSMVLLGAIGGAVLGPELVSRGQGLAGDVPYAGALYVLAALYLAQAGLFLLLGPLHGEGRPAGVARSRPFSGLVGQPLFIVAVLGGTAAYGVMSLIMTATPLSMHVTDGYALQETAQVIRNHVLAMYMPSLVSGFLIERLGTVRMMMAGAAGLALACVIGLQGHSLMHYTGALVLLGVGWNFLYVGGTTLLTLTYSVAERYRAQAVNEFCVFGTSATASLLAGTVIYYYGWHTLVMLPIPLLALTLLGLYRVRRDPLIRQAAAQSA